MDKQNIRIHLRAYDNKILDLSTIEIINTAKRTGAQSADKIPSAKFGRFVTIPSAAGAPSLLHGSITNTTLEPWTWRQVINLAFDEVNCANARARFFSTWAGSSVVPNPQFRDLYNPSLTPP